MNILFITYDYLTQPLGIAYLSGALLQAGHAIEVAALHDWPRQTALLRDMKRCLMPYAAEKGITPCLQ